MSPHRLGLLALLTALGALPACHCNDNVKPTQACDNITGNQTDHPTSCSSNDECGAHYGCSEVKDHAGLSCCLFADRKCATEADCCPGQTCPSARKLCFDNYLSCKTDADCGDKGDRFCETYTDFYASSQRCRFKPCSALGECAAGQACFQGECMADLPCNGTCEAGKGCVPSTNRCQDYQSPSDPARAGASCPVSCTPGFIATFNNNRNIWDSCVLPDVKCVCAELPALQSEDLGRFSSIAADTAKNQLVVSQYDGQYGDLVVDRYGKDGKRVRRDWVDGVPTGTVRYGPSGPRHGVVDPGDDVGRYTDVVVKGELTYVSYYDATHGDLKLATRAADGSWSTGRVDGADANVGLYSSMAVDSEGLLGIAYFQRGGDATFDAASCPGPKPTAAKELITALKYAHATKVNPGPADFTVKTLSCQARTAPACSNCADTCADPGSGLGCYPASINCTGCDPNTEVCVHTGGAPGANVCAKKYNPSKLSEVVDGVGMFASLAYQGKTAVVAYMTRSQGFGTPVTRDGDLWAMTVTGAGVASNETLVDWHGDTGFFPDVAIDPATQKIAISYHDFSSRSLKLYFSDTLTSGLTPEVIDTGIGVSGTGASNWVGASSALTFSPTDGSLYAVYQDTTQGDLKLAKRSSSGWTKLAPLHTEGAVGFFAHATWLGTTMFASHARLHARPVSGEPHVDNSLVLDPYVIP